MRRRRPLYARPEIIRGEQFTGAFLTHEGCSTTLLARVETSLAQFGHVQGRRLARRAARKGST
jgi:hypothetical protein